jgi:hypothetical protein
MRGKSVEGRGMAILAPGLRMPASDQDITATLTR